MSEPVNPTDNDRLFAALRALIRGEFPQLTYLGIYSYVVQSCDGSTVDCDLEDPTVTLPAHLTKVPIKSSVLGEVVTLTQGSRCLITFANADPTKPICLGCDPTPSSAKVEATGTLTLKAGGYPATEHVATVEGVVNMIVALLYVMGAPGGIGNPSTWQGVGKIFDNTDPTMTQLQTTIASWLSICNTPLLPTPSTGGGILLPGVVATIATTLAAKLKDLQPGITPTGIGAPKVGTG